MGGEKNGDEGWWEEGEKKRVGAGGGWVGVGGSGWEWVGGALYFNSVRFAKFPRCRNKFSDLQKNPRAARNMIQSPAYVRSAPAFARRF